MNNTQAIGYIKNALDDVASNAELYGCAPINSEQRAAVLQSLREAFDLMTESEAETYARNH